MNPYQPHSELTYDPLAYHNEALTRNIYMLSSFPYHHLRQLEFENQCLKKKIDTDRIVIDNMSRKIGEYAIKERVSKKTKVENQYKTIVFERDSKSWTEEKELETISSIKSIDDIIKLNTNWEKLRHNVILQKLYYLIPALTKLQNMVGLKKVKQDVFKKIIYYVQNTFDDEKACDEFLHTIISGPPGVGKTEFARIYADIFVRLNILKTDKFIEIRRDDLVAQYLGQTAPKTKELLESALGGVLFLDEAYSLGNEEKRDSFSKEAIDMLTQYLSEKKGQFMFIIAGYEEELDSCLFAYNKGLRRRFHSHFKIDGYKPNELREIFNKKVINGQYVNTIESIILDKFFTENKDDFKYYGGDIEKLFHEIKHNQALRNFHLGVKNKDIIMEDIEESLKNLKENKTKHEPPFGMYV